MKKGGEWEFRQWEQMLGSVTRSENMKGMLRDWDADRSKLETDIESLTAKLEAATTALERLQVAVMEMNHDYQKGDFDLPELASIDLAACVAAALKSIKEVK